MLFTVGRKEGSFAPEMKGDTSYPMDTTDGLQVKGRKEIPSVQYQKWLPVESGTLSKLFP